MTRLDHDANIRPWVLWPPSGPAPRCAGSTSTPRPPSSTTSRRCCRTRTRLVAVTAASNLFGTRPDVARDRRRGARGRRAGVRRRRAPRAARPGRPGRARRRPARPARRTSSSARTSARSPPRPALLERLTPDKLLPSSDAVPERFELGTLPYELLAGVTAGVDFIAGLAPATPPTAATGCSSRWRRSRRTRPSCSTGCSTGLAAIDGVTLHGRPGPAYPHGAVLRRGPHRPRGPRGAGRGRRERPGQQLLRDRGVPARRARRRRRGARRDRALHDRPTTSTGCLAGAVSQNA